jgi:hypothetical protein
VAIYQLLVFPTGSVRTLNNHLSILPTFDAPPRQDPPNCTMLRAHSSFLRAQQHIQPHHPRLFRNHGLHLLLPSLALNSFSLLSWTTARVVASRSVAELLASVCAHTSYSVAPSQLTICGFESNTRWCTAGWFALTLPDSQHIASPSDGIHFPIQIWASALYTPFID